MSASSINVCLPASKSFECTNEHLYIFVTSPTSDCKAVKEAIVEFCSPVELFVAEPSAKEVLASELFAAKTEAFAGVCPSTLRGVFSFREMLFSSCASVLFILPDGRSSWEVNMQKRALLIFRIDLVRDATACCFLFATTSTSFT